MCLRKCTLNYIFKNRPKIKKKTVFKVYIFIFVYTCSVSPHAVHTPLNMPLRILPSVFPHGMNSWVGFLSHKQKTVPFVKWRLCALGLSPSCSLCSHLAQPQTRSLYRATAQTNAQPQSHKHTAMSDPPLFNTMSLTQHELYIIYTTLGSEGQLPGFFTEVVFMKLFLYIFYIILHCVNYKNHMHLIIRKNIWT